MHVTIRDRYMSVLVREITDTGKLQTDRHAERGVANPLHLLKAFRTSPTDRPTGIYSITKGIPLEKVTFPKLQMNIFVTIDISVYVLSSSPLLQD